MGFSLIGPPAHKYAEDTLALIRMLKLLRAAIVGWRDSGNNRDTVANYHAIRLTKAEIADEQYKKFLGGEPKVGSPEAPFNCIC